MRSAGRHLSTGGDTIPSKNAKTTTNLLSWPFAFARLKFHLVIISPATSRPFVMPTKRIHLILWPLVFVAVGCGGPEGPALFPVKGTIKKDGKPLSGVTVALVNVDATKALALTGNST